MTVGGVLLSARDDAPQSQRRPQAEPRVPLPALPGADEHASPAARSERERAARELFAALYPRLAGWTVRLVDDPDTAHDLATEAFVRLLAQRRDVEEPRAWLYATTANLVRDHWRRTARERKALARTGMEPEGTHDVDVATRTTVRELVEALPDRLREPVLLHYYADLSVAQVAAAMGKAEGTVKRALFDARARMAAALEEGSAR